MERERRSSRTLEKAGRPGASAGAATERAPTARHRGDGHRSRSRRRRRDKDSSKRSAVLTPNVEFLRDAYHQKGLAAADEPAAKELMLNKQGDSTLPADTRWSFRAEPNVPGPAATGGAHWHAAEPGSGPGGAAGPAPLGGPLPGAHHQHAAPPTAMPGHSAPHPSYPYAAAPLADMAPPQPAPVRPRHFVPKKWKVARANTVVRATEHLNSEEVQMLQEGEIVEQVAPAFKLKNSIVRIQIRHPSSPQFPNPIGWVTQDATAAGGPKFLEPGPEPMQRGNWRPSLGGGGSGPGGGCAPPWAASSGGWRPPRPAQPAGKGGGSRAPGPYGFQNLTWTPASAKSSAGTGAELITIP